MRVIRIDVDDEFWRGIKPLIEKMKEKKEVVYCKNCKWWGKRNLKDILKDVDDDLRICNYWRRTLEKSVACVRANDFCSKGRKKR